nr:immunoglobulin heavy chain junction region [Macaca mulatta]MOW87081.1 immunoglobulin heavy chain junction region [Macaca mulatta]MOW87350.1 immunoglobulin heavy chain junction region [Macaca mulatta]MOW87477.1 immunoglobulin heavy chain junction region [Macaca mulatta]MOW87889.1 immunoglobulin heavy chain junction region [Macaca mulatta]
CTSRRGGLDYW